MPFKPGTGGNFFLYKRLAPIIPASFPNTASFIIRLSLLLNNKLPSIIFLYNLFNNTSSKYTKLPPITIASGSKILIKLDIPILKYSM